MYIPLSVINMNVYRNIYKRDLIHESYVLIAVDVSYAVR